MRTFVSVHKSVVVCSILLFAGAFILAAFAEISISAGNHADSFVYQNSESHRILDTNDMDTCSATLWISKSRHYALRIIPFVATSVSATVSSKNYVEDEPTVPKGYYSHFAWAHNNTDTDYDKYEGEIRDGSWAGDRKYFTRDYDDVSSRGSAYIYNQDGSANVSASW